MGAATNPNPVVVETKTKTNNQKKKKKKKTKTRKVFSILCRPLFYFGEKKHFSCIANDIVTYIFGSFRYSSLFFNFNYKSLILHNIFLNMVINTLLTKFTQQ